MILLIVIRYLFEMRHIKNISDRTHQSFLTNRDNIGKSISMNILRIQL